MGTSRVNKKPIISDHALVRFLERSMGVDVDALRDKILQMGVADAIKAGATGCRVGGVVFKICDGFVTTCIRPSEEKSKRGIRHG